MKNILFIFLFSLHLILIHGDDDKVNDGASTSGTQTVTYTDVCDYCLLESYALRMVYLMLGEDLNTNTVQDMMIRHPQELEAFYDDIFSCLMVAQIGYKDPLDQSKTEADERLSYFSFLVNQILSQLLQKVNSNHYNARIWYDFDRSSHTMKLYEDPESSSKKCLCCDDVKRRNRNGPVVLPLARRPHHKTSNILSGNVLTSEQTTMYHIVPLSLISRFFRVWLNDHSMAPCSCCNGCTRELYKRMHRSMQKILVVSIKKSNLYSSQPATEDSDDLRTSADVFTEESLLSALSWASGNIFVGPAFRGPFNPEFRRSGESLLEAFEEEAQYIVGATQFRELRAIFNALHSYLRRVDSMQPFWRLLEGFNLLQTMTLIFSRYSITPLNQEQWELRTPRLDEVSNVRPATVLQHILNVRFWIVWKYYNGQPRHPRSVLLQEIKNTTTEGKRIKIHWRKFINNVLKVTMAAQYENEDLPWLCNFTRLFDRYMYRNSTSNNDTCLHCLTFDEYLYSKISTSYEWYRCNHLTNSTPIDSWCGSWRHIMNLNNQEDPDDPFQHHEPKWKYIEDMEVMMNWVTSKALEIDIPKVKEGDEYEYKIYKVPTNLSQLVGENSVTDIAMCLFTVFTASVSVANNRCLKLG